MVYATVNKLDFYAMYEANKGTVIMNWTVKMNWIQNNILNTF